MRDGAHIKKRKNSSFKSLWAIYKTIPSFRSSLCVAQLDTIERNAVLEKDACQCFRVNRKRICLDNRTDHVSATVVKNYFPP